MAAQDTLPVDERDWSRLDYQSEYRRLRDREDDLVVLLAELQRENRELREIVKRQGQRWWDRG